MIYLFLLDSSFWLERILYEYYTPNEFPIN